jgi:hypothetical protein
VSGKNQEDVAEEIMSLYPDTSREDLGRLVPAKWTTKYRHEQSAAAIQQGKRLWRKIQQKDQHN